MGNSKHACRMPSYKQCTRDICYWIHSWCCACPFDGNKWWLLIILFYELSVLAMDKFIVRKRESEIEKKRISDSQWPKFTTDQSSTESNDNDKVKISTKISAKTLCWDSYLDVGSTWFDDKFCPSPKCAVCGEMWTEAMVPSKLTWPFSTKHNHFFWKDVILI
jgi:hypothetical protein